MTSFRGTDQAIEHVLLVPSSGGVFEVTANEEKIYSKRETGRFPEKDEIINKLKSM